MYQTKILDKAEEMLPYYDLIMQLDYQLDRETFASYLEEMTIRGYKQLAVFEEENCVAIAGYWVTTKFYCGRYLELDNVIVNQTIRSKGIGKFVCDRLEEEARKFGCTTVVLDTYVKNDKAHKFYMREGYRIVGFHFIKDLMKSV
jgi:GNAT superfamily N-acetyltransferase